MRVIKTTTAIEIAVILERSGRDMICVSEDVSHVWSRVHTAFVFADIFEKQLRWTVPDGAMEKLFEGIDKAGEALREIQTANE